MTRRIRVAVIGAGWFAAESHIPVLARREDVVLDGVCRLGAAELRRVQEHFGFAFASEDYRAVLARAPEAVIVASPHHLHHEHARAALDAGAHVLCEKPMTLDPAHAWDLVACARARGRQLLVANGHHWLPRMAELRALVRGGAVGTVEHVAAQFVTVTRGVFAGEGLGRWKTAFFHPDRATWQDPAHGGGFAYGQLSHAIALMLWLGGVEPVSASAHVFGHAGIDLCDAAAFACRGGAVATVSGAAAMPEGRRPLFRIAVTGSDGVLALDLDRDRAALWRHDGSATEIEVPAESWRYRCDGPVDALVDLAQGRGENLAPGEIGAATTAAIAALLASARAGGTPVPCLTE